MAQAASATATINTARIISKRLIAADILELRLSKPEGFSFVAGQFTQFLIPRETGPVWRSYSIASTPADPYLEFCVKILPEGLGSDYLSRIEAGGQIQCKGAAGRFVSPPPSELFFVATGVGLAPIMSLITDEIRNKKTDREIRLLFGVRHRADIFWRERLDQMAADSPNFSYVITLSQPEAGWDGSTGRVTEQLPDLAAGRSYYLCGSQEMVREVKTILAGRGVSDQDIHFEIF